MTSYFRSNIKTKCPSVQYINNSKNNFIGKREKVLTTFFQFLFEELDIGGGVGTNGQTE